MSDSPTPAGTACKNCAKHLPVSAKYCPGCGQKKYDGPPTLWLLFSDFFEAVFNLDNRLFRTLGNLPVPGQLTIKYLAGRQQPFFRPLRLFFVATVLMLSAFAIVVADRMGEEIDQDIADARANAYRSVFESELRTHLDSLPEALSTAGGSDLIDTIKTRFLSTEPDSVGIDFFEDGSMTISESAGTLIAEADFYALSAQEITDKYGITDWFERYQLKQILAISRSGSRAVPTIMGQLIWGVLLIVPLAALMLKLAYIRRRRTYVEHLVFTLHVHAFLFLFQALAALTFYWFESPIMWWVSIPVTIVYFIVALKRTYQQGWLKTLLKVVLLYFGYCFILSTAFGIGVLGALALF